VRSGSKSRISQASSSATASSDAFERQAANLLFALVSRRYERGSIIVTSNRGFEQWGEILGDAMVAAALIDRLVHHATMVAIKGKSYRLRERGVDVVPAVQAPSLRASRTARSRISFARAKSSPALRRGCSGCIRVSGSSTRSPERRWPSAPGALGS
jgi:IstB-like ATP binding protein